MDHEENTPSFMSIFKKSKSGIESLKNLCSTALNIRDLNKDYDHKKMVHNILSHVEALRSDLSSLRSSYEEVKMSEFSLKRINAELEKNIADLRKNLICIEKYEFTQTEFGYTVMTLKPAHHSESLPKTICPACVNKKEVSPLQPRREGRREILYCHQCHLELEIKPHVSTWGNL